MWAMFLAPICLCHAKKDFGSLDRESLDRELAQLFFHRTPPMAATSVLTKNIPANVLILLDRVHPSFRHGYCLQEVNTIALSGRRNQAVGLLLAA